MSIKVSRREVELDELRRLRRDVLGLPDDEVERGLPAPVDERAPDKRPPVGRDVERQGKRRPSASELRGGRP